MNGALRCRHCDDVIGVYEAMIVFAGGRARRTSRAAELAAEVPVGESVGDCYHDACYQQAHGEGPIPD